MKLLAAFAVALVAWSFQDDPKPPSTREQADLVESWFALDHRASGGADERLAILARLDEGKPLQLSSAKSWRKKIIARAEEGRGLEADAGTHYFHEKPLGMYVERGETTRPKGLLLRLNPRGPLDPDAIGAKDSFVESALARDWVFINPERQNNSDWWAEKDTEALVIDIVEAAFRTWNIDRNRVYLSGASAGAIGSFHFASRHPDLFAGIVSVVGAPMPPHQRDDVADGLTPNLRNIPMVMFNWLGDPIVDYSFAKSGIERFEQARERWGGFELQTVAREGATHAVPEDGVEFLFDMLGDPPRVARPERVVWQPALAWRRQCYWLYWDEPRLGALVVADLDRKSNTVSVECEGDTRGLEVLLDDELVDLDREVVVLLNGAEVFRGEPQRRLSVLLKTAMRADPELAFEAAVEVVAK